MKKILLLFWFGNDNLLFYLFQQHYKHMQEVRYISVDARDLMLNQDQIIELLIILKNKIHY